MKKIIVRLLLFLFSFYLFSMLVNEILTVQYQHNFEKKINWISSLRGKHYDCVFVGSSRVDNGFDAKLFEDSTGLHTLNMGIRGHKYQDIYMDLLIFFSNNNTCKIAYLQVDDRIDSIGDFHFYDFFHLLKTKELKTHFYENSGINAVKSFIWRYIPLSAYYEYGNYYNFRYLINSFRVKNTYQITNGYSPVRNKSKQQNFISFKLDTTIVKYRYLTNSINLLRKNNVKVYLYTCPFYKCSDIFYEKLGSFYLNFAKKSKTNYINCSKLYFSNIDSMFLDNTHLNFAGTQEFTKYFYKTYVKY